MNATKKRAAVRAMKREFARIESVKREREYERQQRRIARRLAELNEPRIPL